MLMSLSRSRNLGYFGGFEAQSLSSRLTRKESSLTEFDAWVMTVGCLIALLPDFSPVQTHNLSWRCHPLARFASDD
jgi:hypothetical protein